MANNHLQNILQKQVSRKEFLSIIGLAMLSIVGMSHILKLLTGKSLETHSALQTGYGNTPYGGNKDI